MSVNVGVTIMNTAILEKLDDTTCPLCNEGTDEDKGPNHYLTDISMMVVCRHYP